MGEHYSDVGELLKETVDKVESDCDFVLLGKCGGLWFCKNEDISHRILEERVLIFAVRSDRLETFSRRLFDGGDLAKLQACSPHTIGLVILNGRYNLTEEGYVAAEILR